MNEIVDHASEISKNTFVRRKEFEFLFTSNSPNIAVVAARGIGKTIAAMQMIIHRLLSGKPNERAVFFSSTLGKAKHSTSPFMRAKMLEYPAGFLKYNRQEQLYAFNVGEGDTRELKLLSYENIDSGRSFHPHTIVLDECASMPMGMFDETILPMLPDDGSDCRLLAIGTAQGHNKFYELWKRGADSAFPDWESYRIKATDCEIFDREKILNKKMNMSVAAFAQEYECDFNANVLVNSVFGEYINRYTEKNISDLHDYDPSLPVWTSWDLGHSNQTSIWFFQVRGDVVTFIDFFEDSGKDVTHYANEVLAKPYNHCKAILPWDAGTKNIRSPVTISQMLYTYDIKNEVLSNTSVKAGIDSARLLLKTARFNKTKCRIGLHHLRSYKFKINYKTGVDNQTPLHDEHSDASDAFRYAAVGKYLWNSNKNNGIIVPIRRDYNIFV
jgi:hypothetical protein